MVSSDTTFTAVVGTTEQMGFEWVIAQNCYFSAKQNAKRLHGAPGRLITKNIIKRKDKTEFPPWEYPGGRNQKYITKKSACTQKSISILMNQFHSDVQSPCHRVSHTMTNKTNKNKQKRKQQPKRKQTKGTPFADVGEILGGAVGKMFNLNLKGPSRWLGTGIGSIFGSGDYTFTGPKPQNNVLVNGAEIPQFSSTRQTNVVCHREYLRDWTGVSAFSNQGFRLNPGDDYTFPWLSAIAQNYQEYKFHGLVFEFKPLITDFVTGGAPGVVVMATNYNANDPIYASKQQMENSEFAVSVKPTLNLMHGVECDTSQTPTPIKYVRDGPVPAGQDAKLYDLGTFQFANQGSPTQLLGEIWVSYCVEFFKPILPQTVGGTIPSATVARSGPTSLAPLGETLLYSTGNMTVSSDWNSISWEALPKQKFIIAIVWDAPVAVVLDYPPPTLSGCLGVNLYQPTATGPNFWFYHGCDEGVSTAAGSMQFCVQSTNDSLGLCTLLFSTPGTLPVGTILISITQVDETVNIVN